MKKIIVYLGSILVLMSTVSCVSTKKVDYSNVNKGLWKGKTLVFDRKSNKKHTVSYRALINEDKQLRLDFSSLLIGHLASISISGNRLQYLIPMEKRYFSGRLDEDDLLKELPIRIEPKLLFDAFWKKKPQGEGWLCKDKNKVLFSCYSKKLKQKIIWYSDDGKVNKFKLLSTHGSATFSMSQFRPGLEENDLAKFNIPNPF